jgi:hypothetical protein
LFGAVSTNGAFIAGVSWRPLAVGARIETGGAASKQAKARDGKHGLET